MFLTSRLLPYIIGLTPIINWNGTDNWNRMNPTSRYQNSKKTNNSHNSMYQFKSQLENSNGSYLTHDAQYTTLYRYYEHHYNHDQD